jgi:hypothetical protein
MAATLVRGAPPRGVRARRQWLDPETGKWKGFRDQDGEKVAVPKNARTRWRAQASVRLWTGEVAKRDVTGQTAAQAEDTLVERLQALLDESNPDAPQTDHTIEEVARMWLNAPERHSVATSSLGVYESSCRRWLLTDPKPKLAKMHIRKLQARDVSRWLLSVAAASGIPTARTARSVLSTVLRHAVSEGHATTSPVRDAVTPAERVVEAERVKRGTGVPAKRPGPGMQLDHKRALTEGEVARVIAAATAAQYWADQDLADLVAYVDGTGVRIGGALATLWTDLDLDGDGPAAAVGKDPARAWALAGTHTITRVKGAGLLRTAHGDTKKGARWLALDPDLADLLRKRRAEYPGTEHVFPNPLRLEAPREVSDVTKRLRRRQRLRRRRACAHVGVEPLIPSNAHEGSARSRRLGPADRRAGRMGADSGDAGPLLRRGA